MNEINKSKRLLKRYVLQSIAMIMIGVGISMCDHARMGTDPFSVFLKGTSIVFGISLSLSNAVWCLAQVGFALFLDRRHVSFGTVLSVFTSSLGISLMDVILPETVASLGMRIAWMLMGIAVYAFGVGFSQYPDVGFSTYDCFIFSLGRIFHRDDYHTLRWIADGANLVIGWLLGGTVGIATILCLVLVGKIAESVLQMFNEKFGSCVPKAGK
jgi:uncharacterized membrane protein YczE